MLQRGVERLDAELATLDLIAASSDLPGPDETCDQLAVDVRGLAGEVDKVMVRIRAERRDRQDPA